MIILRILGFILGGLLVLIGGFKLLTNFIDYFFVALSIVIWGGLLAAGVWLINACII